MPHKALPSGHRPVDGQANPSCNERPSTRPPWRRRAGQRPARRAGDCERALATNWMQTTAAGQQWAATQGRRRRYLAADAGLRRQHAPTAGRNHPPRNEGDAPRPQRHRDMGHGDGAELSGLSGRIWIRRESRRLGNGAERRPEAVQDSRLAVWDASQINYSGLVTIRVIVFGPATLHAGEDPVLHEGERCSICNSRRQHRPPHPRRHRRRRRTATPTVTVTPTATTTTTPTVSPTPETPTPGSADGEFATVEPPTVEPPTVKSSPFPETPSPWETENSLWLAD